MSEPDAPWSPRPDEPAARHPQLRALVELARAQPLPPLRSSVQAIVQVAARRRATRVRAIVATAVMIAATVALVWSLRGRGLSFEHSPAGEQAERTLGARGDGGVTEPEPKPAPVFDPEPDPEPEPEPAPDAAQADLPVTTSPIAPASKPMPKRAPDAALLARQAEQAMAEQRRGDAIRALTTLVRSHPTSSAARAALLDLGRLLRDDGRRDEARCAYRQLVARWPADPMRAEIDRALASLGAGPACRGLKPARE